MSFFSTKVIDIPPEEKIKEGSLKKNQDLEKYGEKDGQF